MSFKRPRTDALTIVNSQSVVVGATSVQSTQIGFTGDIVRVCPTVSCFVAVGDNPTATTESVLIPANTVSTFFLKRGQRVAVLQVSAGGTCNVTECL